MSVLESVDPPRRLRPAPSTRSAATADGLVLLDVRRGKYYAMNRLAGAVWEALARGEEVERVVAGIAESAAAEPERVEADVRVLVDGMCRRGLLVDGEKAETPPVEAGPASLAPLAPVAATEPFRPPRRLPWVLSALARLLACEALLAVGGFAALHRLARRLPPGRRGASAGEIAWVEEVSAAAGRLHLRRAWCLQGSVALLWLLRRRRVAAELVIGVRRVPFGAHAWVEVGGVVVGDDPAVRRRYVPIDRL